MAPLYIPNVLSYTVSRTLDLVVGVQSSGSCGVVLAEVPDAVQLDHTRAADKEVDGGKRVVDGGNDERVAHLEELDGIHVWSSGMGWVAVH